MISDIDKYVEFLTRNSLNEHQFLILWLVHTKDTNNIAKYKEKFNNFNVVDIEYLIDTGWIEDFGIVKDNRRTFNISDFLVTDKFSKVVIIDEDDGYEELVAVYPKWITINGKKVATTTGDPYKLAKEYFKYTKGNRLVHNRVINITEKYFKGREPQTGIEKYILNRHWNLFEEEVNRGPKQDAFTVL